MKPFKQSCCYSLFSPRVLQNGETYYKYCLQDHSQSGYYIWPSNGKRIFLDNFTSLVCLDLYCEAYFGSYLHFILHIEYIDKVNLEGIGSSKISFDSLKDIQDHCFHCSP